MLATNSNCHVSQSNNISISTSRETFISEATMRTYSYSTGNLAKIKLTYPRSGTNLPTAVRTSHMFLILVKYSLMDNCPFFLRIKTMSQTRNLHA